MQLMIQMEMDDHMRRVERLREYITSILKYMTDLKAEARRPIFKREQCSILNKFSLSI